MDGPFTFHPRARRSADVDVRCSVEVGRSHSHLITLFCGRYKLIFRVQIAHAQSLLQNGHFTWNEKWPGVSGWFIWHWWLSCAAAGVWGWIHQLLMDHVTSFHFCLQEMVPDKLLLCNFKPHTMRLSHEFKVPHLLPLSSTEVKGRTRYSQFSRTAWKPFGTLAQRHVCHVAVCKRLKIIQAHVDGCSEAELFHLTSDTYSYSIYMDWIVCCSVVIALSCRLAGRAFL